jgi:hypothetical protein
LYARQLAFLGATPEKSKYSRFEMAQGNHLGQRDEDGNLIEIATEIQLPEIPGPWSHLLAIFSLSGQALQSGMGLTPLSWLEIKAFIDVNELDITLWERELLKRMSEAYCAEYHKASDPKRPAPYTPEVEENEVDQIALGLQFIEQLKLLRQKKD